MELINIFEKFSTKITQIYLHQRAVNKLAKKELRKSYEDEEFLKNNPDLVEMSSSYDSMIFRSTRTGRAIFFGDKSSSIQDRRVAGTLNKNKQYLWLLVEVHEGFEDYIEDLYAYIGYNDNDFWPLEDYGNITYSELRNKSFEWFQAQARNKKNIPASILNKFREKFPNIAALEHSNKLGINLRLAITLVEFLRHIIVHKNGHVSDKKEFIKRILQKSGLYNNGNYQSLHLSFIEFFFGSGEYQNTIVLVEIPTNPEVPLDTFVNVFEMLPSYLMAYAYMVYEELGKTQEKLGKLEESSDKQN